MSLLEEADGANIGCDDLICMMLQIGLSDSHLRRELGAIRDPTLRGFSEKIEGYEQARKTEPEAAYGNAAQRQTPNRRPPATGGKSAGRNSAPRNRGEKDRRLALRGKCFRCAKNDHMLPACSYPDSVKCNLCGATGHITPACGRRQVAQVAQQIPSSSSSSSHAISSPQQLAIAYDGGSGYNADSATWPPPSSASSSVSSVTRAGAFYTPSNLPTPEMPL